MGFTMRHMIIYKQITYEQMISWRGCMHVNILSIFFSFDLYLFPKIFQIFCYNWRYLYSRCTPYAMHSNNIIYSWPHKRCTNFIHFICELRGLRVRSVGSKTEENKNFRPLLHCMFQSCDFLIHNKYFFARFEKLFSHINSNWVVRMFCIVHVLNRISDINVINQNWNHRHFV